MSDYVKLDEDHYYTPFVHDHDGEMHEGGIIEWHRPGPNRPDGIAGVGPEGVEGPWCGGSVFTCAWSGIEGVPLRPVWTVEQRDPLTLSPSLLCTACGSHGFIREGKWVGA